MTELKPCPFCGGEAEYGLTMAGEEVYCTECKAAMPRFTTEDATIEAWNKRAEHRCEFCEQGDFDGQVVMISNHGWQRINYCPNCGAKIEVDWHDLAD